MSDAIQPALMLIIQTNSEYRVQSWQPEVWTNLIITLWKSNKIDETPFKNSTINFDFRYRDTNVVVEATIISIASVLGMFAYLLRPGSRLYTRLPSVWRYFNWTFEHFLWNCGTKTNGQVYEISKTINNKYIFMRTHS